MINKVRALFQEGRADKAKEEQAKALLFRLILPEDSNEAHVNLSAALIALGHPDLKSQINFLENNDLSMEAKQFYFRFFSPTLPIKMDMISQTLEPKEICASLDKLFPTVYENLIDKVKPYIKQNSEFCCWTR